MQVEGHMAHGKLHDPTTLLLFHLLFLGALTQVPAQRGARSHFQTGSCAARCCGGRAVPLSGRAAGTFLEAGNCQQEKKNKISSGIIC